MNRLPTILVRDYFRHIVWPHIQLFGALAILATIVFGVIG